MSRQEKQIGFTLIELLVAMTIIALLLSIAAPRYFKSISNAEEAVLRQNLSSMRDALDKYHADTGKYPDVLEDLITKKYLRSIPVDPITGSASSWLMLPPASTEQGKIYDIKSGSLGKAKNGSAYSDW